MDKDTRLAEIMSLQQGLSASWPTLSKWIESRMNELLAALVSQNDEQTRGRIKELASLLELQNTLQSEAQSLQQPKQEADFP